MHLFQIMYELATFAITAHQSRTAIRQPVFNVGWGGRMIRDSRPSPLRGRLRRSNPFHGFVEPLGSNPATFATPVHLSCAVVTHLLFNLAGVAG